LGGPFSPQNVGALFWVFVLAKRPGYSLQVLAPIAFAQAAVGFPLLSLPGKSVLELGLWMVYLKIRGKPTKHKNIYLKSKD
jgi:hypothetical protein